MSQHLNLIREISCKNKLQEILASYQRTQLKKALLNYPNPETTAANPGVKPDPYQYEILDVRKYLMMLDQLKFEVFRVFIQTHDSKAFYEVGWVIDSTCLYCLGCCKDFGMFGIKHHCRACGDRICGRCTREARVQGIESFGAVKICFKCAKNRDAVSFN
jgi:hypothetical protein